MRLVIFSYPKHYHLMQLAYRHALTAFDNITSTTIIWDDLHDNKIPNIPFDADVIAHSSIDFLKSESSGWLRQQYVKLNLHKLIDEDEWIILDADTIVKNKKSFDQNQIYTDKHDYYEPYFKFINYAFGIDKGSSPSYMTHFAKFERSVLVSIEQFILDKHNKDLITIYKEYHDVEPPACPGFSEFEIYGLYQEKILHKTIILPNYTIENYLSDNFIKHYNQPIDLLLEGGDNDIPLEFWQAQGIKFQKMY